MSLSGKKLTNRLTEHLFRNFYQEVFSSLVVKFGSRHIDLIEDALQESFYKALKSWKYDNYPNKPKNWLFVVTKNHIINELRKSAKKQAIVPELTEHESPLINVERSKDDQLQLLLISSRLAIKPRAKMIFILKVICGFGVNEIANSLLLKTDNVYRISQRVKQKLIALPKTSFEHHVEMNISDDDASYLLQVIYFMFNEGYDAMGVSSEGAINEAICYEALRLAHLLEGAINSLATRNVLALFYFHMARFKARIDSEGAFVSLRNQDRQLWDQDCIRLGTGYLSKPERLNRYYLEALIASFHSRAITFDQTAWTDILKLYNALLSIVDTPVIRLNRAICLFESGDVQAGKEALDALKGTLENSYLYYPVSMAEYLKDKDESLSRHWFQKSLEVTKQPFRQELIKKKMKGSS
jgi:RNA polymerase sigma-70 factor (ECF subfamily)